ncbi:hypothetical protein I2I11_14230 [Pontibacter sp. 172403-2]|uniref:hypothetical protein n=1 Tax=Pontibacter rufus TaxID=2791028 RepID=UPI0018AFDCBA|nr:hypothetical protein [Pontibacter sp. 172403-2]MBF9254458.1 hypothetical protein [Pontibacter sp. 172403-2]
MSRARLIALIQGVYWLPFGVWPLVHMPSFLWVTGPKVELWLVRTVSLLLIVIGAVLIAAAASKRVTPEIKWLGAGGAAAMAFVDFYYSMQDVIWDTYMLDGIAEIILILLWLWVGRHGVAQTTEKQ